MFRTIVAVAEGLIEEVIEGQMKVNASETSSSEDDAVETKTENELVASVVEKGWSLKEYIHIAKRTAIDGAWIGRIQRTVSYVFTDQHANIVSLILHSTEYDDQESVEEIVSLQRWCFVMLLRLW